MRRLSAFLFERRGRQRGKGGEEDRDPESGKKNQEAGKMNNNKLTATVDETEVLLEKLLLANSLEQTGKNEEAKKLYEEIIINDREGGTYGISAQKALKKLLEKDPEAASSAGSEERKLWERKESEATVAEKAGVKKGRKWPLRLILVAPFVLQIVAAVGVTGFLSFKNGQQAVNDLATELRSEITERIGQQLNNYIEITNLPNQLNSNAMDQGILNARDYSRWERYLGDQLRSFKDLSYISFADEDRGEYLSYIRLRDGRFVIERAGPETNWKYSTYNVDDRGKRAELLRSGDERYDPRTRPWYKAAVAAGKTTWTNVEVWKNQKTLYIDAVQPVYNSKKELVGVLDAGFTLEQIGYFLQSLKIGKTGQTFIIDRGGLIIANSTQELPFVEGEEGELERIYAVDSRDRLTRGTAEYLTDKFKSLTKIVASEQLSFNLEGERQFLQVRPFKDDRGLDWLIVVVIPEADFMEQINANTRNTIALTVVALLVALGVGIITAYGISNPIRRLNDASKAIASGELDQQVEVERIYVDELGSLGSSFNQMALQLRESFEVLEDRVQERTVQLEEARIAAEKAKSALQQGVMNLLLEIEGAQRGDLTVRAEVTEGAVGSIADAFNSTVGSLRNIVLQVQKVANQVNDLADRSAPSMEQLSTDAVRQASEINYTLRKVAEIGESIQRVASSAREGAAIAQAGAKTAREGQEVMDQTVQSIENIRTAVEETGQKVDRLTESFQQIQQILKTISGISERTNLVAYNASIEASRAGELGVGFRVVAEEVRRLAGGVTDATKQIEKIVEVIQKETVEVRSAMETGTAEVASGTQLVDKTKQILQGLADISKKIDLYMESISKNTANQADASQDVNQMMEQVANITSDSSSKAQNVTDSLQDLVTVAKSLQKSVSRFRLEKKS
ncbi:MAG: methyl-accepting chemotaxis protein [Hormoscilla sp.]